MRRTKKIKVGDIYIGGSDNIIIQSMTNTDTKNVKKTIEQILELEKAGCQIVRVSIPSKQDAEAISEIKKNINIPLVADIHFDYKLAIMAMENGVDKLRINPGNIGEEKNIKTLVNIAKDRGIPIRIGVNSGSLEKHILKKYGKPTAQALAESAMYHVRLLEKYNFDNIIISAKSSNLKIMYNTYKILNESTDYPLHLGVTEAGTFLGGTIKSSIGIGSLLLQGIGDTIRVSLTENPVEEIKVAKKILQSLGIMDVGADIISCPTCSRTKIDLIRLAKEVEKEFENYKYPIKIAVMGCAVNGPGEAKEADFGIAGGLNEGLIFARGKIIKKVPYEKLLGELKRVIKDNMDI